MSNWLSVILCLSVLVCLSSSLVHLSLLEVVQVFLESFCSILGNGEQKVDGWMGWDWMVIIGHQSRRSTFGVNNQKRKSLLRYYSSRLRSKVLLKVNIKTNMSKRVRGKTQLFWDTDVECEIYFNDYFMAHMFQ